MHIIAPQKRAPPKPTPRSLKLSAQLIKLDRVERWDKELSLGKQERLAFLKSNDHNRGKMQWTGALF